jgi:hypothetical protein
MTNGLHGARSCQIKTLWIKDVLLGKVRIPMTDEDHEVDTEEGKKLRIAADE